MPRKNPYRGQTTDDKDSTKPGAEVERTGNSLTRRQLLRTGAGVFVGLAWSGLASGADAELALRRPGIGPPQWFDTTLRRGDGIL